MAKIDLTPPQNLSWRIRLLHWYEQKKYGKVLEPVLAWSFAPKIFWAFQRLWRCFDRRHSPLPPKLRALVALYVSQLNHCAFCVDLHASKLLQSSEDQLKIDALDNYQSSDLFSYQEKACLDYAKEMTKTPVDVPQTVITNLHEHFTRREIVELTALIAFQNMSSRFNAALDLNAFGFCKINPSN